MPEPNYLLGRGENLTDKVIVAQGGGAGKPPYTLQQARRHLTPLVLTAVAEFDALPEKACPGDEAVAVVTLHPRFISKSTYPQELLRNTGLRARRQQGHNCHSTAYRHTGSPSATGCDNAVRGWRTGEIP